MARGIAQGVLTCESGLQRAATVTVAPARYSQERVAVACAALAFALGGGWRRPAEPSRGPAASEGAAEPGRRAPGGASLEAYESGPRGGAALGARDQ